MQKKQEQERKEFVKPVITPSGEDYLETILVLQKKLGMVRSVDVIPAAKCVSGCDLRLDVMI